MKKAQAGTLESMDCLVTVTEREAGAGLSTEITGSSAVRFKSAMENKVKEVLASLGVSDVAVSVQDNGALDLVLGARLEAAVKRLGGGK